MCILVHNMHNRSLIGLVRKYFLKWKNQATRIRSSNEVSDDRRSWSDLPSEILSTIADRLAIIELLSFRGTCKDFRSASSTASAEIESSRSPYLLFYKNDTSDCILYNEIKSKLYTMNIPDLQGATCLASYQGWLLLFKEESIFFFCPFSLAKIALPEFPHKQITGHVAAFSDVPTSPDCVVSVINQIDPMTAEITVISKGETVWTPHIVPGLSTTIVAATFDCNSRTFYYMDDDKYVLKFSVPDEEWTPYAIMSGGGSREGAELLPYRYQRRAFQENICGPMDQFDVDENEYLAVFGLTFEPVKSRRVVYLNEVVGKIGTGKGIQNAVWIQPRFFQVEPNQRWSKV